jgi:type VI protein secretion system component VasK
MTRIMRPRLRLLQTDLTESIAALDRLQEQVAKPHSWRPKEKEEVNTGAAMIRLLGRYGPTTYRADLARYFLTELVFSPKT